ncbi:hypothetical protein K438DRAFT_2014186 [Mycena galopus ATCC 62051]|nr:hypothetical protein K438DRAFT_2014186 [Mycena galopus ATCC 62051]
MPLRPRDTVADDRSSSDAEMLTPSPPTRNAASKKRPLPSAPSDNEAPAAKKPAKTRGRPRKDHRDSNGGDQPPQRKITKQAADATNAGLVDLVSNLARAKLTYSRLATEKAKYTESVLMKQRELEEARLATVEAQRGADTEKTKHAISLQEARSHTVMLQTTLARLQKENTDVAPRRNPSPTRTPLSTLSVFAPSAAHASGAFSASDFVYRNPTRASPFTSAHTPGPSFPANTFPHSTSTFAPAPSSQHVSPFAPAPSAQNVSPFAPAPSAQHTYPFATAQTQAPSSSATTLPTRTSSFAGQFRASNLPTASTSASTSAGPRAPQHRPSQRTRRLEFDAAAADSLG